MYVRVSKFVHDPITASALVMDNGDQQAVFVSMDTVAVPDFLTAEIRRRLAKRKGPAPDKVSLCATHTHTSSRFSVVGNETLARYMGSDRLETPEAPENILCGVHKGSAPQRKEKNAGSTVLPGIVLSCLASRV